MNIEEQPNDISKRQVQNVKKSLMNNMINNFMNIFKSVLGFILSIAYATVYGGLATIVGSAVTIFLEGYVDE